MSKPIPPPIVPTPVVVRWWAPLEPKSVINRPQLLAKFVEASQNREFIDKKLLRAQINMLAKHLAGVRWGKDFYTDDGVRCLQAEIATPLNAPEDFVGWARVLDAYGEFCDPIGRYVGRYYYRLLDLRPDGLLDPAAKILQDFARVQACNRLRDGIGKVGFGGTTAPIFASETSTRTFLSEIAGGREPHDVRLHEREALLTFADEVREWAEDKLAGDPWIVLNDKSNRNKQLTEDDVETLVGVLVDLSETLWATFGHGVPTTAAVQHTVDALMTPVQKRIADNAHRIRQIITAGGTVPDKLAAESEVSDEAVESTEKVLHGMLARGHHKTADDALRMYRGRVKHLIRNKDRVRGRTQEPLTTRPGVRPGAPPEPESAPTETSVSAMLRAYLLEHPSETRGGFGVAWPDGRTKAEFDMALSLLDSPGAGELVTWCEEQWPQCKTRAVARDINSFAYNIEDIIKWAGMKIGLWTGRTSR